MGNNYQGEGDLFKIKRFSIHDGPGIRTTVFLKGCPLNCIWCHSPEGISQVNSLWYNKNLCIACGQCVNACPSEALSMTTDEIPLIRIDRTKCNLNGACVKFCPSNALQFTGFRATPGDILSEIEKDLLYYRTSDGGVTLSGGEALLQPEFSLEILKGCKVRNIHTAIETSLFCEKETLDLILPYVDLFIADLKISDPVLHEYYTGKSNSTILDNFLYLVAKGANITVRIPMIENITNTSVNMQSIIDFVLATDKNIPVELISYNLLTENNYTRLGLPFLLRGDNLC
jgi:pyruvate formate lyase activating enzyme